MYQYLHRKTCSFKTYQKKFTHNFSLKLLLLSAVQWPKLPIWRIYGLIGSNSIIKFPKSLILRQSNGFPKSGFWNPPDVGNLRIRFILPKNVFWDSEFCFVLQFVSCYFKIQNNSFTGIQSHIAELSEQLKSKKNSSTCLLSFFVLYWDHCGSSLSMLLYSSFVVEQKQYIYSV